VTLEEIIDPVVYGIWKGTIMYVKEKVCHIFHERSLSDRIKSFDEI